MLFTVRHVTSALVMTRLTADRAYFPPTDEDIEATNASLEPKTNDGR